MTEVTDADLAQAAAEVQRVPTDSELVSVHRLASTLVIEQRRVLDLEEKLKASKQLVKDLSERNLPQAFNSLGLSRITLDSGYELELKPFSAVGVIKERQPQALDHLAAVGGADLVKTEVTVSLGRGQTELAGHVAWLLTVFGLLPSVERTVNFQTLNAWFRQELLRDPLFRLDGELFNVFVGQVVKLKEPREKA